MFMRLLILTVILQSLLTAKPGDLDMSFGTDGIVITDLGSDGGVATGVAIQSDGKIVTAGYSLGSSDTADFALVRYNTNGTLDTSFGADGIVITDVGGYVNYAFSVAIQSDGKIIAAGTNDKDFALVCYDTNGSLDPTFGIDGIVTTDVGGKQDTIYGVAIQSDGKIVAAGRSHNATVRIFALARYDTNGSLDASFGTDGIITTEVGSGNSEANSVAIQSDGKIVAAGSDAGIHNFALVRYDTNGSLDASFIADTPDIRYGEARSVAIQSDGKIVAAGISHLNEGYDFTLARYDTNGSLDTGFGTNGIVTTPVGSSYDYANSVVIQSDGKIVAAGYSKNDIDNDFALVRYDINGSLDTSFGTDGIVTTPVGSGDDYAYSVAIQNDGKIVSAGRSNDGSNNNFALVRYLEAPPVFLAPIYYLLGM